MAEKAAWQEVKGRILEEVFHSATADEVEKSQDLLLEGLLDSLAIVTVIEILADSAGDDRVLELAQSEDFRNLGSIQRFYDGI